MPPAGRKRTRDGADEDRRRPARHCEAEDDDDDEGGDERRHKERPFRLPDGYDDRHRAFLQALMAHGALTLQQAQPLLAAILNVGRQDQAGDDDNDNRPLMADDITLDDMREFVRMAQRVLQPLDLDVRSGLDQVRAAAGDGARARVWALVSTDHDTKGTHLAVLFTPRKLAYLHRLLVALFETYNTPRIEAVCVTEQQALKLSRPARPPRGSLRAADGQLQGDNDSQASSRDKGLKHSAVLALLQALVRQGWLAKSAASFFAPGTRMLLELEPFLVEAFNTKPEPGKEDTTWQRIKHCAACREILTTGLRCSKRACTLRLHVHCEDAFWRTQAAVQAAAGGTRACPRCQTPWWHGSADQQAEDDDAQHAPRHYVGERAITATDVFRRKKRQGRPSEGVDELMRALLPRTVPRGGGGGLLAGRPRQSDVAEASVIEEDEDSESEKEGDE